ncbi:AAA family ATPase [uncultured Desulfosarcina sp.]|uniref:ATP-dependent nuclease n=1 Tax=uncultured Desulfosarcina sp. TaxID=218289 RepID=UPI0029C74CC8|nr:AAA family ATPase [uncultured Desulfosarcina sp.]
MYISKIKISNYRNFKNEVVEFTPGLNVLIGHNNAGKTNLIKALQLVFDREHREKLTIDDLNKEYQDFSKPPRIDISVLISEHEDKKDDKNVIYDWIISEAPQYEAQLTYTFYLPNKHWDEYKEYTNEFKDKKGEYNKEECLKVIEKKFLKKYVSKIFGGDPNKEEKADSENLDRFDFQFLDAIRDAEKQMFFGNRTLLREVLNYFLDYNITQGKDYEELDKKQLKELKEKEIEFSEKSKTLLKHLIGRVSKDKMLEYSEETGADKGGKPDFDAEISEQEILFALRLIVDKSGIKYPIKINGLGYNNLLFIALILSKMQMECSGFMGDNAKVFPILAIEEPEAHLHPSMQHKFLQFLDKNLNTKKQARQVFITSHSTHITSAVDLNSIICLYEDLNGILRIGYPGKTFSNDKEDQESKVYVKRFLDATKSNMLFADRIVFVEGLAEQILLPCLAKYIAKEEELLNKHVSIISVDSRTFKHFLKIFSYNEKDNIYAINKKIVCITDADPSKKEKEPEGENKKRWKKCYPFELGQDIENYEYISLASHATNLIEYYKSFKNIKIQIPPEGRGKTFEYELALNNPSNENIITECFPSTGKNRINFFKELMKAYNEGKTLKELQALSHHDRIKHAIDKCDWVEEHKKKALIAAIYYQAVENIKGVHAFYLEKQLRDNFGKMDVEKDFIIPPYIKEAINFITD